MEEIADFVKVANYLIKTYVEKDGYVVAERDTSKALLAKEKNEILIKLDDPDILEIGCGLYTTVLYDGETVHVSGKETPLALDLKEKIEAYQKGQSGER